MVTRGVGEGRRRVGAKFVGIAVLHVRRGRGMVRGVHVMVRGWRVGVRMRGAVRVAEMSSRVLGGHFFSF